MTSQGGVGQKPKRYVAKAREVYDKPERCVVNPGRHVTSQGCVWQKAVMRMAKPGRCIIVKPRKVYGNSREGVRQARAAYDKSQGGI